MGVFPSKTHLFVDSKAVLDLVHCGDLWLILEKFGVLALPAERSPAHVGLLQGCLMSPVLLIIL